MKKMLYVVLPTLFLSLCAGNIFAQTHEIKSLTQEQKEALAKSLEETKAKQEKINGKDMLDLDLKSMVNAQEITVGEKINLQDILFKDNRETPETKYYKLKLAKGGKYTLLDQKTKQPSEEKSVSWVWNDFLGKYEYAFDFRILESKTEQDNSYLFIAITPVLSKDNEPTLPVIHVAFNFNEKGDITYGGHAYAIDGHGGFDSKLAIRVK